MPSLAGQNPFSAFGHFIWSQLHQDDADLYSVVWMTDLLPNWRISLHLDDYVRSVIVGIDIAGDEPIFRAVLFLDVL